MIPKLIHMWWDSEGPPMPQRIVDYAATWYRPGWEVRLWGDDAYTHIPPDVKAWWWDRGTSSHRSNIVRYWLLREYGGVWVDMDFASQKDIWPLIRHTTAFCAWVAPGLANTAIMGCTQGHPWIVRLTDGFDNYMRRLKRINPHETGPGYISAMPLHDVTVLEKDTVYPYLWTEMERAGEKFRKAWAVHHWSEMWLDKS
jgi:mannosyltransferase OCH1-like enzyme